MTMRSLRRGLMAWSPPGAPAGRFGGPAFSRPASPRAIRWRLRPGAPLAAVSGITRLARATWARWRPVCAIAGVLLVAIGGMLPSGWAFVAGLLVFLLALLREAGPSRCRKADQMTGARWHQ